MHSPNVSGPSVAMRRPDYYPCLDQGPQAGEPPSKILQSLLYNFAHTSYLNTPTGDNRAQRNDTSPRRNNSDGDSSAESTSQTTQDYSRNRGRPHPDMSSPQRPNGYRHLPYPHASSHAGLESSHLHPRCFQNPSSTVSSQNRVRDGTPYAENYLSPRHRSSSIGSAGSSFRDSRSPSHDSTASHDSLSRCSPLSIASSPSPSPPTPDNNTSKLLGILKGASYNYPYATLPTNRNTQNPESTNSSLTSHRRSGSISEHSDGSNFSFKNDRYLDRNKNLSRHKWETSSHQGTPQSNVTHKRKKPDLNQCQDEPIDLSLKPKKKRTDSLSANNSNQILERRLSWRSDYMSCNGSVDGDDAIDTDSTPRKSILESILCGKSSLKEKSESPSPNGYHERYGYSYEPGFPKTQDDTPPFVSKTPTPIPTSPIHPPQSPLAVGSLPVSLPPSPALSVGSSHFGIGSPKPRCPWRQRVTLAKKNLFPVSARVSDWVTKIVNFAKSLPEFVSLPDCDKVTLTRQCWTRLMLLYMAENNFQFAVTPVHEDIDDGRPPAISGIDPTEPTMDSVELVQNFIRKCQNLSVESQEYDCLRLVTLFHAGCQGLENADFVDKISSNSRHALQEHVRKSHPDEKLRYSNLLLCLHTLFGVNCGMVQTLFCKHIAKDKDIDDEIQNLVLKTEVKSEEQEEGIREDSSTSVL